MAYVPGTEIDKPTVDLEPAGDSGIAKAQLCKRALRRAGVPENIITTFLQTAQGGFAGAVVLNSTIADYVEVAT